jgi:hypothetical protein
MSLDRFTRKQKYSKSDSLAQSKNNSYSDKTRIFSPKQVKLPISLYMDKSYTKLGVTVKCPRCGKEGELYIRRLGNGFYAYVLHGRRQCYIGALHFNPIVDKEMFNTWVASLISSRLVTIRIPEDIYYLLVEQAKYKKMNVDEYIVYLISKAMKEDTQFIETISKIIESSKKVKK